jgi:hypothetical protein
MIKLLAKRGEGVVTGMFWIVAVAAVSALIAFAMWGPDGISGAATTAKTEPGTAMTNLMGSGSTGVGSIRP